MKTLSKFAAVVALGAAVTSTSSAFGQADLQLKQARDRDGQDKREQRQDRQESKQENRQEQRADRQERQQMKREREQLNNMPQPVRRALKEQTNNATNIDYFRQKGEGNNEGPTFGATFTGADGRNYDVRLNREGEVLSRTDLTAQQASAQAPATPAPTPAPAPTPPVANAPTTPAPTPTPTPTPAPTPNTPTARGEAPKSGDPVYRRLEANEVPANIRTVLDREAKGGTDVKYYRSKYGQQMSYTVRFDKGGEEHATHVADDGNVLARGGKQVGGDDEQAQTASGSERAAKSDDKDTPIELNAMPRQVQTQFRRLTEGGSDVKFFRTKYGQQQAFQANYKSKDGKQHRVFVDDDGKIIANK